MKKRVLTLTALTALAFSLSACGSINEGVPTAASDSNASTTQEAVSTEDKAGTEQVASTENGKTYVANYLDKTN